MTTFNENVDIADLVRFAKAYRDLGWAVQEQFDSLVIDGDTSDLNENAVKEIEQRMGKMHPDIQDAIEARS